MGAQEFSYQMQRLRDEGNDEMADRLEAARGRIHAPLVDKYRKMPGAPSEEDYDYTTMAAEGKLPDPASLTTEQGFTFLPEEGYRKTRDNKWMVGKPLAFDIASGTYQFQQPAARAVAAGLRGMYRSFVAGMATHGAGELYTAQGGLPYTQEQLYPERTVDEMDELVSSFTPDLLDEFRTNPAPTLGAAVEGMGAVLAEMTGDILLAKGAGLRVSAQKAALTLNPTRARRFIHGFKHRMREAVTPGVIAGEAMFVTNPDNQGETVTGMAVANLREMGFDGPALDMLEKLEDSKLGNLALNLMEGAAMWEMLRVTGAPVAAGVRKLRRDYQQAARTVQALQSIVPVSIAGLPAMRAQVKQQLSKYLTQQETELMTSGTAMKMARQLELTASLDEVVAMSMAGAAKRGWYKASAEAIKAIFGDDADQFTALLAATSPQVSVETNLLNTITTWNKWLAEGRPTDDASIDRLLGESVQGNKGEDSVLDAWRNNAQRALKGLAVDDAQLSGPKVDSFMRNLRGFLYEVTQDTWMARALGFVQARDFGGGERVAFTDQFGEIGQKKGGYLAANVLTRQAAERMTQITGEVWTPAEIQETVWSWAKALYEHTHGSQTKPAYGEGRTIMQVLASGEVTDDIIRDTADFATLFATNPTYRKLLEDSGYGQQLSQLKPRPFGEGGAIALSPEGQRHLGTAAERLDRASRPAAPRGTEGDEIKARGLNAEQLQQSLRKVLLGQGESADVLSKPFRRGTRRAGTGVLAGQRVRSYEFPKRVGLSGQEMPDQPDANLFTKYGIDSPRLNEFEDPDLFIKQLTESKATSPHGDAVYVYPREDYAKMRTFLTDDGRAGFAIKEDGDIVSVFNNSKGSKTPHKSVIRYLVALAVEQGGTKLDAFNIIDQRPGKTKPRQQGFLIDMYGDLGFKEVRREAFDDNLASPNWDYDNLGRPDTVYMELDKNLFKSKVSPK